MLRHKFLLILIILSADICIKAQQIYPIYYAEPVCITASHLYSSAVSAMRSTVILEEEDIASLPGQSISDILKYAGSVDTRSRGIDGVQTDFSLRGSSFEQVIVMIDNIRINDPQTGHHNSDIPVAVSDIERIEILPGNASSLYGPDGFGGVINIITKSYIKKTSTKFSIRTGSFGRTALTASQSLNSDFFSIRVSFEKKRSDGYRPVSDYDIITTSYQSVLNLDKKHIFLFAGYTAKDFGANDFYAPFPSREKTKSFNTRLGFDWQVNPSLYLTSTVFGRRHNDDFILDCNKPDWYRNKHTSYVFGSQIQANIALGSNKEIAAGITGVREILSSSSLGDHSRNRMGLFSEAVYPAGSGIIFNTGLRADFQKKWGIIISPSLGISRPIFPAVTARLSAGHIFRAPTFTELYYNSPANIGDPGLLPERGWSFEAGVTGNRKTEKISITLFNRNENNRIDWVKNDINDPWQVANIGRIKISGFSVFFQSKFAENISTVITYSFMTRNVIRRNEYFSKYNFSLPRHHLILRTLFHWHKKVDQSLILRFKEREGESPYSILCSKIIYFWNKSRIFIEAANITDISYEEVPGLPMPGFNLLCGFESSF